MTDELVAGVYVDLDDGGISIVLPHVRGFSAEAAESLAQALTAAVAASREVSSRNVATGN